MPQFVFSLIFDFGKRENDLPTCINALCDAGWQNVSIVKGQQNRFAVNFSGDADSALRAVKKAYIDVKELFPAATFIEACPDQVGLSEIAALLEVTRQNIRKLAANPKSQFPMPLHEGNSSIWHLADVLQWRKSKKKYKFDQRLLEIANANMRVNIAKQVQNLGRDYYLSLNSDFAPVFRIL
jgi:predicted DNA-binding transcriptional regulator AlpA